MNNTQYIYAVLRGPEDWASIVAGEPHLWSYDKTGTFKVEPEVLAERADPHIWSESGWDAPPRGYPALAVRVLAPAPAPATPTPAPEKPVRRGKRKRKKSKLPPLSHFRLLPEVREQLDCLCEAYRLYPAAVISRLVSEAYRRDVVESGLLAVMAMDEDIIAPIP